MVIETVAFCGNFFHFYHEGGGVGGGGYIICPVPPGLWALQYFAVVYVAV
jgi:hypothetical protein